MSGDAGDVRAATAVTTSGALLDGLHHLAVRDVAVASPYLPALRARLDAFLHAGGFRVVSHHGLDLDRHIWRVPADTVRGLVRAADRAATEAVFIACANLPTCDLIAELEADPGKPVLTANQVSLWSALRGAGATQPDQPLERLFGPAPPDLAG